MITENDLHEAIAECQGQRNPTANTCIKLAAFYIILDKLYPKDDDPAAPDPPLIYSGNASPVKYFSDTDFGKLVNRLSMDHVLSVIDELMSTIQVLNPRLYAGVLRKLEN